MNIELVDLDGRVTLNQSFDGVMLYHLPASFERSSKGFGGQASKGIRWMPWHQEAKKDVVKLR
jgi:hypothetical protein